MLYRSSWVSAEFGQERIAQLILVVARCILCTLVLLSGVFSSDTFLVAGILPDSRILSYRCRSEVGQTPPSAVMIR